MLRLFISLCLFLLFYSICFAQVNNNVGIINKDAGKIQLVYYTYASSGSSARSFNFKVIAKDPKSIDAIDIERQHRVGKYGQHLRGFIKDCPDALKEMNNFRKQARLSTGLGFVFWTSIVGYVGGSIISTQRHPVDANGQPNNIFYGITRPMNLSLIAVSIGTFFYKALIVQPKEQVYLENAVGYYNDWIDKK